MYARICKLICVSNITDILSSIVWNDQAKCAYTNLPCHAIYRNYCIFKHLFICYY